MIDCYYEESYVFGLQAGTGGCGPARARARIGLSPRPVVDP